MSSVLNHNVVQPSLLSQASLILHPDNHSNCLTQFSSIPFLSAARLIQMALQRILRLQVLAAHITEEAFIRGKVLCLQVVPSHRLVSEMKEGCSGKNITVNHTHALFLLQVSAHFQFWKGITAPENIYLGAFLWFTVRILNPRIQDPESWKFKDV